MPEVSVIIPNYNHAPYLKQRIDSVLNQTFVDFEIIILDDCSTDNSRDIIEPYREHPAISHIIFNEINSGTTFRQWEKGIALAGGNYIWIAESDDWCEPTLLAEIMSGLLENKSCTVGFCQSFCTDGLKILWHYTAPNLAEYIPGKIFVETQMIDRNAIFNASMAVWKREAFFKISKKFTQFRFCGDWLFWIELCLQGDVFISGKLLNYFRKHEKDVSGRAYQTGYNFQEEIEVADILLNDEKITFDLYLQALRVRYHRFKGIKNTLSAESAENIQRKFFKTKAITRFIRHNNNTLPIRILRRLKATFNV